MSVNPAGGPTATKMKPTELKIGTPAEYDGDHKTALSWLNSVRAYVLINKEVYDNDNKRVVFALSHMKKGVAQAWASDYFEQAMAQQPVTFGTFDKFIENFKKVFTPIDSVGSAIAKLRTLSQRGPVEEYISEFHTAAVRSKITDNAALIEFFTTGLKSALVHRILGMDTIPDTIELWYSKASHFDNQWLKAKAITARSNPSYGSNHRNNSGKKKFYQKPSLQKEKDPNAMDVDVVHLSKEDRDRNIKEGCCFNCSNRGHMSRECPNKNKQFPKGVKKVEAKIEEVNSDEEEGTVALITAAKVFGKDF